jgi:hypothetical protein
MPVGEKRLMRHGSTTVNSTQESGYNQGFMYRCDDMSRVLEVILLAVCTSIRNLFTLGLKDELTLLVHIFLLIVANELIPSSHGMGTDLEGDEGRFRPSSPKPSEGSTSAQMRTSNKWIADIGSA